MPKNYRVLCLYTYLSPTISVKQLSFTSYHLGGGGGGDGLQTCQNIQNVTHWPYWNLINLWHFQFKKIPLYSYVLYYSWQKISPCKVTRHACKFCHVCFPLTWHWTPPLNLICWWFCSVVFSSKMNTDEGLMLINRLHIC